MHIKMDHRLSTLIIAGTKCPKIDFFAVILGSVVNSIAFFCSKICGGFNFHKPTNAFEKTMKFMTKMFRVDGPL